MTSLCIRKCSGSLFLPVLLLGMGLEVELALSSKANMDQYKFHMSKLLTLYTNGFNVHKLGALLVSIAYSFSPAEDRPVIENCLGQHDNETVMELINCYMQKMNLMGSGNRCEVKKLKDLLTTKMAAAPPIAAAVLQKYAECICQSSGAEGMVCVQQKTMDYAKTFCSAIISDD